MVAVAALVLLLTACTPGKSDTAIPTSSPAPAPVAPASTEFNGAKYTFVADGTKVSELKELVGNWAGYVSAVSLYVDPNTKPDNKYHWFADRSTVLAIQPVTVSDSMHSRVILIVHSTGGGYQIDAAKACSIILAANSTRKHGPAPFDRSDPAIVEVTPIGDTCSRTMPNPS